MDDASLRLLRHLLADTRLLSVAVVVDGEPLAGVVPFLAAPGFGSLLVHVSRLARHTRGLETGAAWSGALQEPDTSELDALAVPRLILSGHVEEVAPGELETLGSAWAERYPSAAMTLALGDFRFRRLAVESGRLIAGFAQAAGVSPRVLAEAAALDV
jgi:putative heme iron utilization protein